jgi:hypothetical protein
LTELRRKRLEEKKMQILLEELARRIPKDEFLSKLKSLDRIVTIMEKNLKNENLNKAIYQVIEK